IIFGLPASVYRVHTGLLIALAAAALFAFLLWRTSFGYEIRAVGQSQKAARYAGVSVRRTIILTMLIAGAFSGLAGAVQIAGVDHNLTDKYFSDTTGFDAIAVALLGLGSAVGIVLASVLFGALHSGGAIMQSDAGISSNLVLVLQALILFSIAANFVGAIRRRLPLGRAPAALPPELPPAAGPMATIHAVVSIQFRADQIVSGIAINIFAAGLTVFLANRIYGLQDVGHVGPTEGLPNIDVGGLDQIPFFGKVLFQQNVVVYMALVLLVLVHVVLFRTRLGLRIRAVGEHPQAADTAGINVYLFRY